MAYKWREAAEGPAPFVKRQYRNVTRSRPCPICRKPDWCSISTDGEVACCMRIADGAERSYEFKHGVGYYHRLVDASLTRAAAPPAVVAAFAPPAANSFFNWTAITQRYIEQVDVEHVTSFAESLGVSVQSLRRLDMGRATERHAWSFPMHNAKRTTIGIRLRSDDGSKFAVTGSHAGCFIPCGLTWAPLLICEGPTDTAAALTLGFDAIGRPSNSGGTEIIYQLLAGGRRRDVIIVRDADAPGQTGATHLADRIVGVCRTLRVISPAPNKDLRDWLLKGATREKVQQRIEATNVRLR